MIRVGIHGFSGQLTNRFIMIIFSSHSWFHGYINPAFNGSYVDHSFFFEPYTNFVKWSFFFSLFVRVIKTEKFWKQSYNHSCGLFSAGTRLVHFFSPFFLRVFSAKENSRKWLNNLYQTTISDYLLCLIKSHVPRFLYGLEH